MKPSKLLALGALALACLAFASPAVTADVLGAPSCTLDFLDPASVASVDEVCAIDRDPKIIFATVLSPDYEDEGSVHSISPRCMAWPKLTEIAGTTAAMHLRACRLNDPGWLRA